MSDQAQLRKAAEARLTELRRELEMGRQQLAALEARTDVLRQTITRIAGAVQVLEELLSGKPGAAAADAADAPP